MKKTISIVLVLLLGMVSIGLAAEDTWTKKADMPTARGYLATAVVNGRIYAIGGAYGSTSGSSAVEEYDPSTDTWTRKANMPQARSGFSTSVIDGKIYVIGGGASPYGALRSSIYTYDPEIMPIPRAGLSANIVDGKIIGGSSGNLSTGSKTVEVYDPDENNWTRKADMPTARFDHRASVVDRKIYVIGGTTGSPSWAGVSVVEVYDPANDSWTRKANMPTPRWGFAISEVDGKIYAIGGASAPSWFSTVEQYNPATNTWITKTPMSIRRREFSASVVGGKIYAIGGASGNQGATYALATVEEYDTGLGPRSPDFNSDGIVDSTDMCILVENWQTDNPLCDIAPPPFGDGIVDVEDLKVLAEHLFEVYPYADTVDVSEANNGGQIELELDKLLVVTLESNPSTGYQWELIENNDVILKQFGQTEFKPSETSNPRVVGAGGWEIFRFKAVSAGQTTLELVYHRSWEDAEPLKAFSIQVTVP